MLYDQILLQISNMVLLEVFGFFNRLLDEGRFKKLIKWREMFMF